MPQFVDMDRVDDAYFGADHGAGVFEMILAKEEVAMIAGLHAVASPIRTSNQQISCRGSSQDLKPTNFLMMMAIVRS